MNERVEAEVAALWVQDCDVLEKEVKIELMTE